MGSTSKCCSGAARPLRDRQGAQVASFAASSTVLAPGARQPHSGLEIWPSRRLQI